MKSCKFQHISVQHGAAAAGHGDADGDCRIGRIPTRIAGQANPPSPRTVRRRSPVSLDHRHLRGFPQLLVTPGANGRTGTDPAI